MKNTKMLIAAIAVAVMTSGIALMPGQAAPADCSHDFDIDDQEPTLNRQLTTLVNEVGRIVVDDAGEVTVKVSLRTSDDELEFGVFYLDGMTCEIAIDDSLADCEADEMLETKSQSLDEKTCVLQPAPSGQQRQYFFNHVNIGDSILGYKTWEIV